MERLAQMPRDLRKLAIGAILVSLVVGVSSSLLFFAVFQFRLDWFTEPSRLVAGGE